MRNITVTVPIETWRQIRAWCAQRDTCISHVVAAFLNDLPRLDDVRGFPLPAAPEPGSLGELYNLLENDELEMLRLELGDHPREKQQKALCERVHGV